jgi:hypothetical protein
MHHEAESFSSEKERSAAVITVRPSNQSGYFSANSFLASFSSAVRVSSASFA